MSASTTAAGGRVARYAPLSLPWFCGPLATGQAPGPRGRPLPNPRRLAGSARPPAPLPAPSPRRAACVLQGSSLAQEACTLWRRDPLRASPSSRLPRRSSGAPRPEHPSTPLPLTAQRVLTVVLTRLGWVPSQSHRGLPLSWDPTTPVCIKPTL